MLETPPLLRLSSFGCSKTLPLPTLSPLECWETTPLLMCSPPQCSGTPPLRTGPPPGCLKASITPADGFSTCEFENTSLADVSTSRGRDVKECDGAVSHHPAPSRSSRPSHIMFELPNFSKYARNDSHSARVHNPCRYLLHLSAPKHRLCSSARARNKMTTN